MADKKISELPLLNSVSGSSIIVPIVHDGTTVKLNLSQLGQYASQWSAKTGSANTFTGNQTINGNLSVSGKITVNELVAVYETASVVFSSGSNIFGDAPNDIHQFTGSVDVNGTFLLNGSAIGLGQINAFTQSVESQLSKVYNATSSLQEFTASQDGRNFIISEYTSSTDAHIVGISAFTSSQLAVNTGLASVTASINSFTSSQLAVNTGLASVSASLNNFTASQDTRNFVISQFTASTNNHIVGISDFTSSQLAVNLGNSIYTSSVDNHIVGISAFTSSQLAVNLGISSVTGSLIGITNALMGFTASLDNTFATDAQLYQLYQATRSIELHSGSMVGITNGLMAYTSSNETWKTGVRGEISAIEAWTASLDNTYATDAQLYQLYQATRSIELHSGSMIGITNGLMAYTSSNETWKTGIRGEISGIEAWTASLDNTYATDAQLYQLYAATASLNTATGSIKDELAGLESYTASLKAAAIVSSSTQITNYYKFAETASANTFYGTQTINGNLQLSSTSPLVYNAGNTNAMLFGFFDGGTIYGPYYQIFGSNYSNVSQRGSAEFVFDSRNGGYSGFNVAEFNGSTWLRKFRVSQYGAEVTGSFIVDGGITGSIMATNNVVSSSTQIQNYDLFALNSNLYNSTGSIKAEIAGIEAYTSSLKSALTISGTDVTFAGKITAQEFTTVYTTSSVLYQSGSTKFGNSSDDTHEFTGSKFEVFNSDSSGTMYAVVKNNRARNAAVKTTTINGSFIAGTSIGTDAFQYQIYDEVEGVNRVTINSQGGTTLQGAVSASQTLRVSGVTQIGTSTVDTSLGSNTKLKVVGDGNVNAGASQGSMFVAAGVTGGDTGLPVNMGTAGASMMLLASINTSTGTSTNAAQYLLHFYFDGNNLPNVMYVTGSSNWATFSVTSNNTLAISGSSSGNKSYAWWINKFGA